MTILERAWYSPISVKPQKSLVNGQGKLDMMDLNQYMQRALRCVYTNAMTAFALLLSLGVFSARRSRRGEACVYEPQGYSIDSDA